MQKSCKTAAAASSCYCICKLELQRHTSWHCAEDNANQQSTNIGK